MKRCTISLLSLALGVLFTCWAGITHSDAPTEIRLSVPAVGVGNRPVSGGTTRGGDPS